LLPAFDRLGRIHGNREQIKQDPLSTQYTLPFRRYQVDALATFEQARERGRDRTYLVMPPGAGKTVVGLEIARRLDRRALALAPNTAVQAQWLQQWDAFQPRPYDASTVPFKARLTVLTYAAICRLDPDNDELDEQASSLWRRDLEHYMTQEAAEAELARLEREMPIRFGEELSTYRRKARELIARGGDRGDLLALLHPSGRGLVESMKGAGPWTLILDECHHLLSMWGYLAKLLIEELQGDVFVVGLTATPPSAMDAREHQLYDALFGAVDFEIGPSALVKEGNLAPYQTLAYLTEPLPHEIEFIDSQHTRFGELLLRLLQLEFASSPFVDWLERRVNERVSQSGARVSWTSFAGDGSHATMFLSSPAISKRDMRAA
jgi:superfamily II DNA or RNA helicase